MTSSPQSKILPKSTDVLIIGAGPVGLAAALSLLANGVKNIAIVDAQAAGKNLSRAIVIHAKTVEELDTIGCADALLTQGNRSESISYRSQTKPILTINFASLVGKTRFPYALVVPQPETERILEAQLKAQGVSVLRPFRFQNFEQTADGLKVSFESGEVIETRYIIGADGSRSTVRKAAGIPFRDPSTLEDPYPESEKDSRDITKGNSNVALSADIRLRGNIPACISAESVSLFLSPHSESFLLIPLPSRPGMDDTKQNTVYRFACQASFVGKEVTVEGLQRVIDMSLGLSNEQTPKVDEILWSSRFRIRSALADTFYHRVKAGVVFLIGDAAHIHSPIGGQGMNLGVREAIDLGRTIGAVFEDESTSQESRMALEDQRFQEFSVKRRMMAMNVIKMTKIMSWITSLKSAPARMVRNAIWRLIGRIDFLVNGVALKLSGL